MAFRCSKLRIIIFQGMSEERRIIMRNLFAFVSYTPVSYTHLDVYKRQIIDTMAVNKFE